MKLFKKDYYYKNKDLRDAAIEIVDKLAPRWPWEDVHEAHINYVLSMLIKVKEQS